MDPACILMCANIPRGIPEEVLTELFCVAGPIQDVSISKSGRSCFIIYEFPEAVPTAKEIFKDVQMHGRFLEMLDQSDIKKIHEYQEKESLALELQKAAYAEVSNQNPFYNSEAMAPTSRNAARNRPTNYPPPNFFMPTPMNLPPPMNHFTSPMNLPSPANNFTPPMNFTPPANFNRSSRPQNHSFGDNYDPSVPNRRWGSAPEVSPSLPFNPAELDSFKSPYSQPVSRKGYEQSRRNHYNDDTSNYNQSRNRSFHNSKRNPDEFSSDLAKESPNHKKFWNDNHSKDTSGEYAYEKQNRRHYNDTPKKSYHDNRRYNNRNSKYNSGSTSSDPSNRYKSRGHDRSSYSRNNNQQHHGRV